MKEANKTNNKTNKQVHLSSTNKEDLTGLKLHEQLHVGSSHVAFILIVSSLSPVEDSKAFKFFTVANLLYQLK